MRHKFLVVFVLLSSWTFAGQEAQAAMVSSSRYPDFAVRGGHGWFVTLSARITERIFPTAADFWRPRFAQSP